MQIEVAIPLIVLGFLIPLGLYLLYRRYQIRKAQLRITGGELFDKEGDRLGLVEEGT
jgi:hypothetical protein